MGALWWQDTKELLSPVFSGYWLGHFWDNTDPCSSLRKMGHRGGKWQPDGGLSGEGTSPNSGLKGLRASRMGTDSRSDFV